MPLTADERHLVYEVLGVPNAVSGLSVYADDPGTGTFELSMLTAKMQIDLRLDVIDVGDPSLVTRLQVLLADWKKISTSATRLHPLEGNQGVDRNPEKIRRLIRERVQVIVPVRVGGIDDRDATALPLA